MTFACVVSGEQEFVGNSSLRWGGEGGERVYFNTTERGWETRGVEGAVWRKNPLSPGPWSWQSYGQSTPPVCQEPATCAVRKLRNPGGVSPCRCSGSGVCSLAGHHESNCADMPQMEVVDVVRIPDNLPAGDYVLGWRWDCEQSTQVSFAYSLLLEQILAAAAVPVRASMYCVAP